MRTVLVVNPRSAGGRTGARLGELQRLADEILGGAEIRTTESGGDGRRIAREAVADGAGLVVAVGGDGTMSEVVDGVLSAGGGPAVGLVPAGTGSDLARRIGVPKDWRRAFEVVRDSEPVVVDGIEGHFTQPDGSTAVRYGINVVGIGMAGDVVGRVNRSSKRLGGRITFLAGTLRSLVAWTPPEVELRWSDGGEHEGCWSGRLVNVFVANGSYCGGGMLVAPHASMRDGLFDVLVVPDEPKLRLLLRTPHLYDGSIDRVPGLLSFRCTRIRAIPTGGGSVPTDLDGETPGTLPALVVCLPGALRLRAPVADPPFQDPHRRD